MEHPPGEVGKGCQACTLLRHEVYKSRFGQAHAGAMALRAGSMNEYNYHHCILLEQSFV